MSISNSCHSICVISIANNANTVMFNHPICHIIKKTKPTSLNGLTLDFKLPYTKTIYHVSVCDHKQPTQPTAPS